MLRNPNATRDGVSAVSMNSSSLNNTVSVLHDPENERKLVLVGTMNASDFLAFRTKMLLKDLNPDSLLVQTNDDWFTRINKLIPRAETNREIY